MDQKDVYLIMVKFFSQEISEEEFKFLEDWLKKEDNLQEFKEYEKIWFAAGNNETGIYNLKQSKSRYLQFIRSEKQKENRQRKIGLPLLRIAAIFTGLFIGIYILITHSRQLTPPLVEYTQLEVSENENITLKTETGQVVELQEQVQKELKTDDGTLVGKYLGKDIIYQQGSRHAEKYVMHELAVPRGKRIDLVLADGTKVWLNSESVLKYPTNFSGKDRTVVLEGEAFFEVQKNQNKPFLVKTSDLTVRVLGTSFNLSSYKSDEEIKLTLEEGQVAMYKKENSFDLNKAVMVKPNQHASFNKKMNHKIKLRSCNPDQYSSWRFGKLQFRNEKLMYLIPKLERWYDVSIVNENEKIKSILFTGSFDNENILQVMETLKRNTGIKYQINNKQIQILP